jgi:hypothetical protein
VTIALIAFLALIVLGFFGYGLIAWRRPYIPEGSALDDSDEGGEAS